MGCGRSSSPLYAPHSRACLKARPHTIFLTVALRADVYENWSSIAQSATKGNHVGTACFNVCPKPEPTTFLIKKWFVTYQCLAVLFCNMDSWNTIYTNLTPNSKHSYKSNFFFVKIIILSDGWDLFPDFLKKHRNLRIKKIILKCIICNTNLIWKICCLFPVLNSFIL